MKSHLVTILLLSFTGTISTFADHFTLDLGTATQSNWTLTTSDVTNATPFLFYSGFDTNQVGLSVSSRGNSNGFYLNRSNFSTFDGYWTATAKFYLPPTATNVVLTYTNLGFDDAGAVFLNGLAMASTFTTAASNGPTQGKLVLTDGDPSQTWTFTGPDYQVSGTALTGFVLGATNTLTAVVNNTGNAANGNLRTGFVGGDKTEFDMGATLSYDVFPAPTALAIAAYPGIQITGTIGGEYQIQYTTNLTSGSWITLTNLTLPNSPFLFFDTNALSGQSNRFYRAVPE